MLELINFANYDKNREMIQHSPAGLKNLLAELGVDGIEALFCDPWDTAVLPAASIHGVHLNFWPTWLDFWRGDQQALARQFGSKENILACFGGTEPEHILACYRRDISQAKAAAANYVVFHVSHNELDEIYTWRFRADSLAVVDAVIEVVNLLVDNIPPDMAILFENLWWPGLTLLEPRLVERLLSRIHHPKVGIMLDTGHLMNTNSDLQNERQGVEYVLNVLGKLGSLSHSIRGIHLHQSLSGAYVRQSRCQIAPPVDLAASMAHIMQIDQHRPFSDPAAKQILEVVQPEYLVHEFIVASRVDLVAYTAQQRRVLR
jgi:sugar phosphate isomerase/epimerase